MQRICICYYILAIHVRGKNITFRLSTNTMQCFFHYVLCDILYYYNKRAAEACSMTAGTQSSTYVWFSVCCTLDKGPLQEVFFGKHLGVKIGPPSLAREAV